MGTDIATWAQVISAVGTFALAILTFRYVRATQSYVATSDATLHEIRETRLAQTRPYVFAYLTVEESAIYITVRNTGQTGAESVRITRPESLKNLYVKNIEPTFLKMPIPFFPPGHRLRSVLKDFIEYHRLAEENEWPMTWECTLSYNDPLNSRTYDERVILDLEQYRNSGYARRVVHPSSKMDYELVKEIQLLKDAVRELGRS